MSLLKRLFGGANDGYDAGQFKLLIEGSMEGLRIQTDFHQKTWGFGDSDRWDFSQDNGLLIFTFPDRVVSAPAQIIDSYDSAEQSSAVGMGKRLDRAGTRKRLVARARIRGAAANSKAHHPDVDGRGN